MMKTAPGILVFSLTLFLGKSIATDLDCSCGYSVNSTTDVSHAVFTEILETDFRNIVSLDANPCWAPQSYNVSLANSHGEYGKMATPQNVIANPLRPGSQSIGVRGGEAGLQLWVNSTIIDGNVPMAEIVARNSDVAYGSYRVGMRITDIPGTCSAFFWYRDDTEEIDMEFLSSQFNETSHPVFLVMQTPHPEEAGTPTYAIIKLPFAPSNGFHEYRFDWTPEKVSFYGNGIWIQDMFYKYSDAAGHLTLNHWSNGNQKWSEGPPASNAVTTISYVKAYFNSSDPAKQSLYHKRCRDQGDTTKICRIPDQLSWPVTDNGTFFFSGDMCGEKSADSTATASHTKSNSKAASHASTTITTASNSTGQPFAPRAHQRSNASFLINSGGIFHALVIGMPMGLIAFLHLFL